MTATPIDQARLLDEGRALRALARSLLGVGGRGVVDADDLVQEGAVAALRSDGTARRSAAWLAGTMRNLAKMLQRGEARRSKREQVVARELAETRCDPAAIAVQAELARDVATAVQELAEPFRTVVVLRFWNGLLPEAIAEQLGVPRNTVRSRLQRGLERLRGRLDAKYGTRERWSLPLLLFVNGREVAGGAVVGGGVGLAILGVLMQAKMLVGAAVMAAAAFVWFSWPRADAVAAPSTGEPVAAASATPTAPAGKAGEDAPAPQREAVAAGALPVVADDVPFDPTPVLVPPWAAKFFVFDENDRPVADATVTIWSLKKEPISSTIASMIVAEGAPRPTYTYRGREQPARHTVRTDETGRVSVVLDGEAYEVEASKDGVGGSEGQRLWHPQPMNATTNLQLRPALFLHGRVLRVDGGPAFGAEVTTECRPSTALPTHVARAVAPMRTDAEGRFVVPVQRMASYRFLASLDGVQSFGEEIFVRKTPLPEITLVFPGAISVTGLVVDAEGAPVAGAEVTAWRDLAMQGAEPDYRTAETVTCRAGADGRFSLYVRRHARYQVLAAAEDRATSDIVPVETTAARPHAVLRLALPRFATIRGRVVREDGSPLPGLRVLAQPESGRPSSVHSVPKGPQPAQVDMFPRVKAATVADDGAFALTVHPGTTWTLTVRLVNDDWRLAVHQAGIAPGRDDVVFTVTKEDFAGCVVAGNVIAPEVPSGGFKVTIVDHGPDGQVTTSSEADVRWDGACFECRPLPRGQLFGLRVEPVDRKSRLAPTFHGPFRTESERLEVTILMAPWGTLPVCVLRADGSPARKVDVYVNAVAPMGFGRSPMPVDAEGRVSLPRCAPGVHRLYVSAEMTSLHEQEVRILSGANPELVIRLPR